jgi:5-methylcytosine-specific restriction endonuclease McrA
MRKLDSFFNINTESDFTNIQQFEVYYWTLINPDPNRYKFKKPIENLKYYQLELEQKGKCTSFEYCFITLLIKRFKKIVLMKPEKMERVIRIMDSLGFSKRFYKKGKSKNNKDIYSKTEFCEKLIELLRYNDAIGGGDRGKDLARTINIKACLYCNSQYSFSYKYDSKRISKLQLDHFYSKSKYPYFSISLYNLIPSCSYCNQKKSNTDFDLNNYSNPYVESLSDRFDFALSEDSEKKLLLNYKIAEKDVDIILDHDNDTKVANHDHIFDLKGIYSNHKDIVIDILRKGKSYPEIKRKQILDIMDENGNKLFDTEDDFKRIFFDMPLSENEINKQPLAKLKRDFAVKAGIIKS